MFDVDLEDTVAGPLEKWARKKASELRAQAAMQRFESSGGSTLKARRKYDAIDRLNKEASKFDRLAANYARTRQ